MMAFAGYRDPLRDPSENPFRRSAGRIKKMMATAGALLSAAVTVLAVVLGIYTMMLVGRMRGKHGVNAPAVTGAPEFERAFRVQMNTLEQSVLFLPLLWLATVYPVVSGYLAPGFGFLWLIGRVLYSSGYMADPAKRSTGFLIAGVALLGLLVLSIVGIVHAWLVIRPI
jgi:glutathione S-transferase